MSQHDLPARCATNLERADSVRLRLVENYTQYKTTQEWNRVVGRDANPRGGNSLLGREVEAVQDVPHQEPAADEAEVDAVEAQRHEEGQEEHVQVLPELERHLLGVVVTVATGRSKRRRQ